ncbi:MAG: hypothetical protein QXU98_11085, partial [Candidatus Parvarchaeota archaeon]
VIYDNTTKNYVSQYDSFKTIVSGPQTATLNGQDNYTIYALYFTPINVTTDFLNEPQAFGSYFGWQTFPYNITNVVNNAGISVNKATNTYFSLPTEASNYIPNYAPQEVEIQEGYYNANKQFTSTTMTISDYNNMQNCYTTGEVGQCLIEGTITGVPSIFTTSTNIINTTPFWNFTFITGPYVFGNISYVYYYQTFAYSIMSPNSGTLWHDRYDTITSISYLNVISPLNITLNYGYMIPVFLSYNINQTGSISSCQELESLNYPSLYDYLTATTTTFTCNGFLGIFNTQELVSESYDNTVYVYSTNSNFVINDVFYYRNADGSQSYTNKGKSAFFGEICNSQFLGDCNSKNEIYNNYSVDYYYNSTISGFGSVIVNNGGSSSINNKQTYYLLSTTSYPSSSTINAYAFYERTS